MVRILSRSLTVQLRSSGGVPKVNEKLLIQLKPYEIKAAVVTRNPRGLACYLEALLNKAFFEDFESTGFEKSGATLMLNPMDRCAANLKQFRILDGLTWEEVLSKGTRHFSKEFSRLCDQKMSKIVSTLGCNRAFAQAAASGLLRGLEKVCGCADKARRLVPSYVRAMVAPGFYVYGSVVKCKVLCR